MMPPPSKSEDILAGAIERFARLRGSQPDKQAAHEIEAWLNDDPEHRDAMLEVCERWTDIASLKTDPAVMFRREAIRREVKAIKARRYFGRAIAACLVVAVISGATLAPSAYRSYADGQARAHATTLTTGVGEVKSVQLADGSTATLDTGTTLKVWQVRDARFVELVDGRARFQVAKDAKRPFSVLAGDRTVTAVGTDFDVYLRPDGIRVNLVEGRLHVKDSKQGAKASIIDMIAGYRLNFTKSGWALARSDTDANTAWTQNRLNFQDASLDDIADELNRYSARKIVLSDAKVGQRRMTAMISSVDRQSFLDAVEALDLAKVRRRPNSDELLPL